MNVFCHSSKQLIYVLLFYLFILILIVIMNLLADLLTGFLDPRVRLAGETE